MRIFLHNFKSINKCVVKTIEIYEQDSNNCTAKTDVASFKRKNKKKENQTHLTRNVVALLFPRLFSLSWGPAVLFFSLEKPPASH